MGTIQIRNLPDETIRTLKVRAASSGQSLQEYMRELLIEFASKPTVEEWMERIEREDVGIRGASLADTTERIRQERDSRDSERSQHKKRTSPEK